MKNITKLLIIGGVRPHFMKIAALQSAIFNYNKTSKSKIVASYINSGQHYDAELIQSIQELNIKFDYTLTHSDFEPVHVLGNMISNIYDVFRKNERPDWVVVIGDTSTTLSATIAASRSLLPVVHLEAGIRAGNLNVVEEANRRAVDHLSSLHFCITKSGVGNLAKEGITDTVYWTGDLSYDYFFQYAKLQPNCLDNLLPQGYILVTLHKANNFLSDENLKNLVIALHAFSKPSRKVVFVTHPKTRRLLHSLGLPTSNIIFLDSLPYGKMISAIKGCLFLVTDSGGLQKEAYYLRKRCLVRRDTPGWTSLIEEKIHRIVQNTHSVLLNDLLEMEEVALSEKLCPEVDDFFRENSCQYALDILSEFRAKWISY